MTDQSVRRIAVDIDGHPFAALLAGADGPRRPVLFVHGFTGSKEDASLLLGAIAAAGHPALAFDQRGMYETPGPAGEGDYSLDGWARDTVLIAGRWGGGPVHLIGHSFGGYVGRAAVVAAPAAFASVVLLASGRGRTVPSAEDERRAMLTRLRSGGHAAAWKDDSAASPERAALMRTRFWATQPAALSAAGAVLAQPQESVDELAVSGVPVLVVHGSAERLWTATELSSLARALGREPIVIAGSGHVPNEDNPQLTAEAMLAFWSEVDRP